MPLFNAVRRFRRAAMEGVNWPRILGYSVLEIALVVIGILIALQGSTNDLLTRLRSSR